MYTVIDFMIFHNCILRYRERPDDVKKTKKTGVQEIIKTLVDQKYRRYSSREATWRLDKQLEDIAGSCSIML